MADLSPDMGVSRRCPVGCPVGCPVSGRERVGVSRESAPYVVGLSRDTPHPLGRPCPEALGWDRQRQELVAELVAELVDVGQVVSHAR